MNKIALILTAVSLTATAAETAAPTNPPAASKRPRVPVEQTVGYQKHFGGDVIQPGTMRGKFVFFDETGSAKDTDAAMRSLRSFFRINMSVEKPSEKADISNAERLIDEDGANAGVFLVSREGLPTLLTAPQSKWAFVNLATLKADNPKPDVLSTRIRKMLTRAFAYISGGGASELEGCVMNPVFSNADIDKLGTEMISPDGGSGIPKCLPKMGINPFRRVTYLKACREGWAPSPTNEYQSAIYEKVKAESSAQPKKGIKIEYDPKKGR